MIHAQVMAQLLACVALPADARLFSEAMMAIHEAASEIVAECLRHPRHADHIIATGVGSAAGAVGRNLQSARDTVNITKRLSGKAKRVAKTVKKVSYVIRESKRIADAGDDVVPLLYDESAYVEAQLSLLFEQPEHLPATMWLEQDEAGEWMLYMLTPEQHLLVLPASEVRLIDVSADEQGNMRLILLSNPQLNEQGELQLHRRELHWTHSAVAGALGGPVTVEAIAEQLQEDAILTEHLFAAHRREQHDALAEYRAHMRELQQCFPYAHMEYLPEDLHVGLPDPAALAAMHKQDLIAPLAV